MTSEYRLDFLDFGTGYLLDPVKLVIMGLAMLAWLSNIGLSGTVTAVIISHSHEDHMAGNGFYADARLHIHDEDLPGGVPVPEHRQHGFGAVVGRRRARDR